MNNGNPGAVCGDDDGNGCGLYFPLKAEVGLCAKCTKLLTLEEGTPMYAQRKVCLNQVQITF